MHQYNTVAIVGPGLVGGSIGLALRERKLAREVIGIGRKQLRLDAARQVGAIDRGVTDLAAGVAQAQLVVVCTPVDSIAEKLVQAAAACRTDALLTDAGSTKEAIVTTVDAALVSRRGGPRFVGSHPLAGDHRTGAEFARGDLFEGRAVIVTPTEASRAAAVTELSGFWQSLGAVVKTMSPAEHDRALATTSHLPHLVAAALAAATPSEFLPLVASGWRDTTRVAGGDPKLWQPIFATNRPHVLEALDRLTHVLARARECLDDGDYASLSEILEAAAKVKRDCDALGD